MAEGKIIRLGGGRAVVIDGQEVIIAKYQENINQFSTVTINKQIAFASPFLLSGLAFMASLQYNSTDSYLAACGFQSPFVHFWKRNGLNSYTKLNNPAILPPGNSFDLAYSQTGEYVVVGTNDAPYMAIYKRDVDTFIKLANPSVLPPLRVFGVTFSNNGDYMVLGGEFSGAFMIYKRSGDTFTKITHPTPDPVSGTNHTMQNSGLAFSPDDTYLAVVAVGPFASPNIFIYKRSGDTFTLLSNQPDFTRLNDSTIGGERVRWSPDGQYISIVWRIASLNKYIIHVYRRDGDVFTKLPDLEDPLVSFIYDMGWTPDSKYLFFSYSASPGIKFYERKGDDFILRNNVWAIGTNQIRGFTFTNQFDQIVYSQDSSSPRVSNISFNNLAVINNNTILTEPDALGYALEDGLEGESKEVMVLFGQPTTEPLIELTAVPTGQLSDPPPLFLRVTITNTTNAVVEVDARLFNQNSPNTLLGVNNLPTTLNPNQTFGPTDVASVGGFTATYILQVRIKEAGKAFSTVAEDILEIVQSPSGDGGGDPVRI